MVRLRNTRTGVIVRVDEDLASLLGGDWVPVEATIEPTKRGPGRPKKSE